MSSIATLAETLRKVAAPGVKPKALVASVRQKHPDATKKEIVRAAFYVLTEPQSLEDRQMKELHDFSLNERATDEEPAVKPVKLKKKSR